MTTTRTLPQGITKRTAPLAVCVLTFASLGLSIGFISGRGVYVKPIALDESTLPPVVGEWRYKEPAPGWTTKAYPAGGTLYRYEREDGAVMLVTAGVSQQRDVTFANVPTVHEQTGHEVIARRTVSIDAGDGKRRTNAAVLFYSGSEAGPAFAFMGLFGSKDLLTPRVVDAKIAVTWHRALGDPEPWFAAYFGREMTPEDDRSLVAQELTDFARDFLPTLDRLRGLYAAS